MRVGVNVDIFNALSVAVKLDHAVHCVSAATADANYFYID